MEFNKDTTKNNYNIIKVLRNGDKYDYITKLGISQFTDSLDSLINQIKLSIKRNQYQSIKIFNYNGLEFSSTDLDQIKSSVTSSLIFYAKSSIQFNLNNLLR